VGGPITDGPGWEWIFLINVPAGFVLLATSPVLLLDSRDQTRPRAYDPAGVVTITVGLIVFIYAIAQAPAAGWVSARTIGLLLAAAALIGLFVLVESHAPVPPVQLGIFRSPGAGRRQPVHQNGSTSLRSYVATARKHGMNPLVVLCQLVAAALGGQRRRRVGCQRRRDLAGWASWSGPAAPAVGSGRLRRHPSRPLRPSQPSWPRGVVEAIARGGTRRRAERARRGPPRASLADGRLKQRQQQAVEAGLLVVVQVLEHGCFDRVGGLPQLVEHLLSCRGEGDGAAAAVGRVAGPLDQAALLQQVQERDRVARVDADQLAQAPLVGHAQVVQGHEDAEVVGGQAVVGQHPRPAAARLGAEPGQQVAAAAC
jgi:hypothetical protein